MDDQDPLLLRCANTHLYRGARLQPTPSTDVRTDAPRGLHIAFRDGVEVPAELLRNTVGELAIDVPAYTTAAGTAIPAKAWRIRVEGSGSELVVIARLSG